MLRNASTSGARVGNSCSTPSTGSLGPFTSQLSVCARSTFRRSCSARPFFPRLYRDRKQTAVTKKLPFSSVRVLKPRSRPTIESKVNDVELISRCASRRSQPLWINYAIEYPLLRVSTTSKKDEEKVNVAFFFFFFPSSRRFVTSTFPFPRQRKILVSRILLLSTRNRSRYIYAYRSPVSPYANPLSQAMLCREARRAYARPYSPAYSFPLISDWER